MDEKSGSLGHVTVPARSPSELCLPPTSWPLSIESSIWPCRADKTTTDEPQQWILGISPGIRLKWLGPRRAIMDNVALVHIDLYAPFTLG
jgi:hypothetical protein